jgi:ketosteroid isomerase-like protein
MAAMMLASPEADIRAALDRQQSAWNHGDVETFMTGYDNSPETTFQGRALTRGYAQVLERYKRDYPTRERMGTLTFSEIEVKPLGNAAALVLGRFSLERSPAAGGPATGRFTLIFRKTRQGWKIIHDHTS